MQQYLQSHPIELQKEQYRGPSGDFPPTGFCFSERKYFEKTSPGGTTPEGEGFSHCRKESCLATKSSHRKRNFLLPVGVLCAPGERTFYRVKVPKSPGSGKI